MALPVESPKLFTGRVPEAWVWDAKEDEVDQRKVFLKPSSSGYHKQQSSSKGKGKSSASGFGLLQARWWLVAPGRVKKGWVLTTLRPIGSPPMVASAPSSPSARRLHVALASRNRRHIRLQTISEGIQFEFLKILSTRNAKR